MIDLEKISPVFHTKIVKKDVGRGGNGIYKRRNNRSYRVLMRLKTYKQILKKNPDKLDTYKRGYAVWVEPGEYLDSEGNRKESFPESLELGENSFIYFQKPADLDEYYKFCKDFDEVVELSKLINKKQLKTFNTEKKRSWFGEYCLFVTNRGKESLICGKINEKNKEDRKNAIKNLEDSLPSKLKKYGGKSNFIIDKKLPDQTGLGNFDFDYASKESQNLIKEQLTYMAFKIPGFKELLAKENEATSIEELERHEKELEKSCKKAESIDFERLSKIGVWHLSKKVPICPLCKETLKPEEFLVSAEQAEGREVPDNTQTETVLMHIDALTPGEFNHCIYNLGWGHKHCNTIQGDKTIKDTIKDIKRILSGFENSDHLGKNDN